ncbi:MAG: hypothetical protein JXQ71_14075 [Verrucomicrobia bacterium]|nr:hypothetical protein [Verrucomicrobiota bacterium]
MNLHGLKRAEAQAPRAARGIHAASPLVEAQGLEGSYGSWKVLARIGAMNRRV